MIDNMVLIEREIKYFFVSTYRAFLNGNELAMAAGKFFIGESQFFLIVKWSHFISSSWCLRLISSGAKFLLYALVDGVNNFIPSQRTKLLTPF